MRTRAGMNREGTTRERAARARTTREGFTLLETIVAIAISAIVLTALTTVATSSLRIGRDGNFKIQATQLLDTVGRRVAGGQDLALLPTPGAPIAIDYGEVGDLVSFGDTSWSDLFRVTITRDGSVTVGASSVARYRIEVCHRSGDDERCVRGTTLGREGSST